jgi:nucleotide-binding universal stress UspA family protein
MANPSQNKLLLAIEVSEWALDAVKYVSKFPPFHTMHAVLFNVFSGVPESYWDLEKDPQHNRTAREVSAWETQQRKVIKEFMDQAKQLLIHSGFPLSEITVKVQNRKSGIARDILREAERGYAAVVIGRKGTGIYNEIIVGSVANKIVEKASFLPVLMIGPIPPDENILIAMDSSGGAMRAIEFVAATLSGFNFRIHLLHVVRSGLDLHEGSPHLFLSKASVAKAKTEIQAVFDRAKGCLTDAGFEEKQITTKVIVDAHSRAEAIIQEAREQNYGTIVMGRRGLSKVQEFFLGRISSKIIHTIRNRAVWVIT